jgi:hypothetical protein
MCEICKCYDDFRIDVDIYINVRAQQGGTIGQN